MTMRIYKSTDASAPTLQGIVGGALSGGNWADGSLLNLLKKCLVDGYGSKTAAGWSLAFSGTSEGAFRMGGGNQRYLNVIDDGTATAGAREAKLTGYGAMTALHTGTDQFPSSGQNSGVLFARKSDTADTVQRSWQLFADDKTFYLFVYTGNATAYYSGIMFGDFYSFVSGDTWNTAIIARATSAAVDALGNDMLDQLVISSNSNQSGHYIPRAYNQLGTSISFYKQGQLLANATAPSSPGASALLPFPNNADGKLWLARCYIFDGITAPAHGCRGFLRGFWIPQCQGASLPFEYAVSGTGPLSGRTFKTLGLRTAQSANGRFLMETSDTWD